MLKKYQTAAVAGIFVMLLLLIAPSFIIALPHKTAGLTPLVTIIYVLSVLYVLFVCAIVVRNYMIRFLLDTLAGAEETVGFKPKDAQNFLPKALFGSSTYLGILLAVLLYGVVTITMPVSIIIPCTSIFLAIYLHCPAIVPDKI